MCALTPYQALTKVMYDSVMTRQPKARETIAGFTPVFPNLEPLFLRRDKRNLGKRAISLVASAGAPAGER